MDARSIAATAANKGFLTSAVKELEAKELKKYEYHFDSSIYANRVFDSKGVADNNQGHFENHDAHTSRPIMDTCLAALQLMVYYRYLPTTQVTSGAESGGCNAAETAVDKGNDVDVVVEI